MSLIVAGNFPDKAQADSAIAALLSAGIDADRICSFAINPPGQHAAYPIGGDEDASAGATEAGGGAVKGAAIGSAVGIGAGAMAMPFAGPISIAGGAAIGAYVGSLVGALNSMGDDAHAAPRDDSQMRSAGVLVAVTAPVLTERAMAADVLLQSGARDVEQTEGTWRDGKWVDFDPVPDQPAA